MQDTDPGSSQDKINAQAERRFNDQLAQSYFSIWDNYPIQRYTHSIEASWMTKLVRAGDRVLLAGSGGGREIDGILNTASRIVAMDISPEMLRVGKERFSHGSIEWRLGDIQAPPEDLGVFEHVFALGGVYAYLPEPERATQALFRHLVPGGSFTICVMNGAHPTERTETKLMPDGRLRRAFVVEDLKDLLQSAGFEIDDCRGLRFFVDLLPPDWNRAGSSGRNYGLMERSLELEEALLEHLPAEKGKFIWITGRKPA